MANVQSTLLLETKYGLRLEIYHGHGFRISDISPSPERYEDLSRKYGDGTGASPKLPLLNALPSAKMDADDGSDDGSLMLEAAHRYRIWPDFGTSYFWSRTRRHDPHISWEEIASLYPFLEPFYFDWNYIYESSFKQRGCHLGGDEEVFEDVHEEIAWETEGILFACWIALQDDVEDVEYKPSGEYLIERGNMGEQLGRFLGDMEVLLGSRRQ
jgi:hypothetical protein